jgi:hypothetical protein
MVPAGWAMEERDWSKIISDRFDDVDFCFVEEIRESQAFDDVDKVRVTFQFASMRKYSTERQKQKKAQELIPLCNRLIKEYPRCMFSFCYRKKKNEVVVFLESPLIPEPVKPAKPIEYYRGLPKIEYPLGDYSKRTYDVPMDKLIQLTLCPADQIKTVLEYKGLASNSLTYSNLIDLVLDYRVVVRHFKKGQPICVPFSDLPDSFDGAIRLIDKVVFFDLYCATKSKTNFQCYCCGAVGQVIHHINGDHYDMAEENLVFLCNDCHYQLHRGWIQSRGVQGDHRNAHDPLAVT